MSTETMTPDPEVHEKTHPSPYEYVKIALVLALLTGAEVSVSYMHMARGLQILLLLGMMAIKFALVVLWYMHLKFDSPGYGRMFTFGIVLAMTVYGVVLLSFHVFQG